MRPQVDLGYNLRVKQTHKDIALAVCIACHDETGVELKNTLTGKKIILYGRTEYACAVLAR